jgi:hypothetical protein
MRRNESCGLGVRSSFKGARSEIERLLVGASSTYVIGLKQFGHREEDICCLFGVELISLHQKIENFSSEVVAVSSLERRLTEQYTRFLENSAFVHGLVRHHVCKQIIIERKIGKIIFKYYVLEFN